jgi:hypothetical protein
MLPPSITQALAVTPAVAALRVPGGWPTTVTPPQAPAVTPVTGLAYLTV